MGKATDSDAVVDSKLQVLGIEGLRVVDASVMPTIVSGNTQAATIVIAEKGAAMMKEHWITEAENQKIWWLNGNKAKNRKVRDSN